MPNDVIDVQVRNVPEKKPGFLDEPKWANHWLVKLWSWGVIVTCVWQLMKYAAQFIAGFLHP